LLRRSDRVTLDRSRFTIIEVRSLDGAWITGTTLALGLLFLTTYVLWPVYRLFRDRKLLCPRFAAIGHTYSGADFTWEERPIGQICRSVFVLWNAGVRTIKAADVPEGSPIVIGVAGQVLAARTLAPTAGTTIRALERGVEVRIEELPGLFSAGAVARASSIEIVHDSPDHFLTVTGQIGDIQLSDATTENDLAHNPGRPAWLVLLAAAVAAAGELSDWLVEGQGESPLVVLLVLAISLFAIGYLRPYVALGRDVLNSGDSEDGNETALWMQRVPRVIRSREDIGERHFWNTVLAGPLKTNPMPDKRRYVDQ
jgi:hypothetical protein